MSYSKVLDYFSNENDPMYGPRVVHFSTFSLKLFGPKHCSEVLGIRFEE